MSEQAPFIPPKPDDQPTPATWSVFKVPGFTRLWFAQVISSLGDWIGLVAILAVAARVSPSGTGVGLVMVARMLPGFILAPLGGVLVDRWNRKVVMVSCDIGRAGLLALLPFFDSLGGLILISFLVEVLTLLWGPAKDASVPNVVTDPQQLPTANSLSLVAAYGTFPLGAVIFAGLAAVAKWFSDVDILSQFDVDREWLALWFDSLTFLGSALLISRLRLREEARAKPERPGLLQTYRDMVDGLSFVRSQPLVRGVMLGLAGGLIGGGSVVPLGPVFAREVLDGGSAGFGLLMTALGVGAALGIVSLLVVQGRRRFPRETVFTGGVVATGVAIVVVACVSTLTPAVFLVGMVGASAGAAYVTGFTLLQENVSDDLRGRTFATLYTIVRVCLLLSLTIGPFAASLLGALAERTVDGEVAIATFTIALPGVRLALWLGGAITILAGVFARRRMRRAHETVS